MSELDDHQLLTRYARDHSDAAFTELVNRYVSLVYSVAWRAVGNGHAAEEITQAVFIILAQKAARLSGKAVLSGWLYQTARLTAANFLRGEIRRQKRESEACMQSTMNQPEAEVWPQIAPLLDEALGRLGERDRNAIVLRFLENKSLREVGAALGSGEDAAKMRVSRALEKLRKMFHRQGVSFSAAAIAGAVAAHPVQAAPAGLAHSISVVALTKGAAAGGSTLTLVKGALKIMAWTKAKTAIVAGVSLLLVAIAYGFPNTRIVFPPDLPSGRPRPGYDLMLTLTNEPTLALQAAIEKKFGLVGHTESIATNVFLLRRANPAAPGFRPSTSTPGAPPTFETQSSKFDTVVLRDQPLGGFVEYVESAMGRPVMNDTGLDGHYDLRLRWRREGGGVELQQALSEQLGLELVSTNLPVAMLVVEKAK